MKTRVIFGLIPVIALLAIPAQADPVADYYKGKTITVVSSGGAGGAHGAYA